MDESPDYTKYDRDSQASIGEVTVKNTSIGKLLGKYKNNVAYDVDAFYSKHML